MISPIVMDSSVSKMVEEKSFIESLSDEDIVRLAQEDIDSYRSGCDWVCPDCGYRISYLDSLSSQSKEYIHELKCSNTVDGSICSRKMRLDRFDNSEFYSCPFNVLFEKYMPRMVRESEESESIDCREEVFSLLISSFLKVVAMFARDSSLSKTSNRWFSSFFWKSMKNRVADLRKTNGYRKRAPAIFCEICGKEIGHMTSKHLASKGHERVLDKVICNLGKTIMSESGEMIYYDSFYELEERSRFLGSRLYYSIPTKERKEFFDKQSFNAYFDLYPMAYVKNGVVSVSEKISEESETEVGEKNNKSVLSVEDSKNVIEEVNLRDMVGVVANMIVDSSIDTLSPYLEIGVDFNDTIDLIKQVVYDKASYPSLKTSEIDDTLTGIKSGFSSEVIRLLQEDKKCRTFLLA